MDVALERARDGVPQAELRGPVANNPFVLSAQETECLRWCKEGKTNWEIAGILRISEKTVEFHLGKAMKKLGAGNRTTAVVRALKLGLITL
jgi:DNA-binding CsgD family transcriptional regulator